MNTSTWDIDIADGELSLVSGPDAIAQHLLIRLRFVRGEWFLDNRIGIPYYEQILLKNPNLVAIRGLYRLAILSTPGVEEMQDLELNFDRSRRTLELTFSAKIEGEEILRDFSEVFIL